MTTAPALDPSAARAAAVQLYAASRAAVSMANLSTGALVELVGDCRAAMRSLEAVQTLAVARLAAREHVVAEDGTMAEVSQGLGYLRLDAPALVCDVLAQSAAQAATTVDEAVLLAARTPSRPGRGPAPGRRVAGRTRRGPTAPDPARVGGRRQDLADHQGEAGPL